MSRLLITLFYMVITFVVGVLLAAFRHFIIQPILGMGVALTIEALAILVVVALGGSALFRYFAHHKRFGNRLAAIILGLGFLLLAGAAFIDTISAVPITTWFGDFPHWPDEPTL